METYDDRPVSVYDNLNMPAIVNTSTPRVKIQTTPAAANGTTNSPYSDISFRFNDNNKTQQQQQQQQLLPNGNKSPNERQQQTPPNQVYPGTAYYAPPPTSPPSTSTTTASTVPLASPAQRPLSQHSQSELNEASLSIAAVKAALNDAKSKFFGLNGYAQDSPHATASESQPHKSLSGDEWHRPKVQIVTPPQPKYQNIPENSAIFRKQPPELPPKPSERRHTDENTANPTPAADSYTSTSLPSMPPTSTTTQTPVTQVKLLPNANAAYKEIALNDISSPHPSQAVYMSTTVPQNIKGSKIAGRHTPTRNSLRHSRMIVVNKHYQDTQYPNPMNFNQPNLARWLLILQTVLGVSILFLAIWILVLAPNVAIQDNPYWSGLALLLAGSLGLVLIRYQRIKRHKVRENCFIFLRADSYLLSLLAVLLCVVAIICAAIHFGRLTASDTKCVSTNILLEHGSCSCTFNSVPVSNITDDGANGLLAETAEREEDFIDRSYKVEYRDLSCQEVTGEWTYILAFSIALNSVGFLVSLGYIVLLACYRQNSKRLYTSVHTSTF